MNRRDAEAPREDQITEQIIGGCIRIHRELGPGLLESAYEECLCYELPKAGLAFQRQVGLPVQYESIRLDCGYRIDLIVDNRVIVELKAVEKMLPIHDAQLLTYLKLAKISVGLLINFNVPILKAGVKRIVNHYSPSASPHLGG